MVFATFFDRLSVDDLLHHHWCDQAKPVAGDGGQKKRDRVGLHLLQGELQRRR